MDKNEFPISNRGVNSTVYNVLHPSVYHNNFQSLLSFKTYILIYAEEETSVLLLVPTLRKLLKDYEEWEGYEQCTIINNVIKYIEEKRNKRIKKNYKNG